MEAWTAPTLEGRIVRLEPLRAEHEEGLWLASRDPRTWRWLSVVQPQTREESSAFVAQAVTAAAEGREIPLVTLSREEVVGSTR
jgi:N-acetyltransferase